MLPREHYLKQSFVDSARFPNGFEKSGLSAIQARLVRKNGMLISALCIDEVSDPTHEDLHILKVIANQSSPRNPVEQAWVKYLTVVKNLAAANPKGKGKAKAAKPEPTIETELAAEAVKPVDQPTKAAEKTPTTAKAPTKKAGPAPAEATAQPAAKKEKAEPIAIKAPAATVNKAEPVKANAKKADNKIVEAAKVEAKKPAAKKPTKKN